MIINCKEYKEVKLYFKNVDDEIVCVGLESIDFNSGYIIVNWIGGKRYIFNKDEFSEAHFIPNKKEE